METSLSVSTLRWFSAVKRRQCGSSWDKCFLSKKKIHCREQGFWGCQWAGLLHTAGKRRECPLGCCRAPSWKEVGRDGLQVLWKGLLKGCLVQPLKKWGGRRHKTFPFASRFSLAEKPAFTGTSLCPCSYHSPVLGHPERGCLGEAMVKSVEPQRWSIVSMGLQGKDQQRPGRPALVTKVKAQAFLGSCYYLPRTDCGSSGQRISGSCHIALEHWGLNSNRRWVQATNAGVISNNYLENREQVYPWGILDGTHLVFSSQGCEADHSLIVFHWDLSLPSTHTCSGHWITRVSLQLGEKQHCKYVLTN